MTSTDCAYLRDRLSACFPIEASKLEMIVSQLVDQTKDMKLNRLTIQPIFKQIRKSCPKSNLPEMNTLFKCCYVLILTLREKYLLLDNVGDLCGDYPEFVGLPADELAKLLEFRNAMKISLQLIEAKHHKGELLEICGRLSGKLVTTGGSQTKETKRRVMIYEREAGLEECDKKTLCKKRQVDSVVKEEPCELTKRIKSELIDSAKTTEYTSSLPSQLVKCEISGLPDQVISFLDQQLRKSFCPADAEAYLRIMQKTLIQTTTGKDLNKLTLRPVLKELRKLFSRKEIWAEMNILFKCSYVLILSLRDNSLMWMDPNMLIQAYPYPEFADLTEAEAEKLLLFRNAMRLSLQLIEAKHHKGELLEIAGRLSGRVVTTGGGQTIDTTRCVMIYEQEGGISGSRRQKVRTASISQRPPRPQYDLQQEEDLNISEDFYTVSGRYGTDVGAWDDLIRASSLQRAGTDFSILSKTFSLQSTGLETLASIGNLSEFLNIPGVPACSALSTATTLVAGAMSIVESNTAIMVECGNTGVVVGGRTPEIPTDIDTELDSIEVATEVDETEVRDYEDEGDGDEAARDAIELHDILRTQSVCIHDRKEELLRAGSLAGGMIDLSIGRVGTLNPEVFNWSQ